VRLSLSAWIESLAGSAGVSIGPLALSAIEKYIGDADDPFVMMSLESIDERGAARLVSRVVLDQKSGALEELQKKSEAFRAEAQKVSCGVSMRHHLLVQLRDVPDSLRFLMMRSGFMPASKGTYELVFQKRPEPWKQMIASRR